MFSSVTLGLFVHITMQAPPVSPISCSSSGLANSVLTLTKSGIKRGFSSPLPAFAFEVAPRKTCGSLSRRGIVLSVSPAPAKGQKRRGKARSMRDTSHDKEKLIRELNTLRCHSLLKHKRFGHSPSSVCRNMRVTPYKSLTEECARKACAQEANNPSACTWNERTYIKLSPPGLSVPRSKINCISRRFRLVLLPLHCLTPQTLMSSMVWLAELKCSATGSPGDQLCLRGPKSSHTIQNRFTCQSENVVYCITCRRCTSMCIGETGRRLPVYRNRSPGLPVAEHFNSANHTIDDIRFCGVTQCSGSNTSRKRREMQLIFELGALKPSLPRIRF